ncbi:hypothetical protein Tco_1109397 [Tanacetum coccineum]
MSDHPELQNVSPSANTTVPSQQELDLLFGPLYDEFFNDGTSRVNKSSSPTDDSAQQDTLPSTNIHPTTKPSTPTHVNAEENNNDQAELPIIPTIPNTDEAKSHTVKLKLWKSIKPSTQDDNLQHILNENFNAVLTDYKSWELVDKPFGKNQRVIPQEEGIDCEESLLQLLLWSCQIFVAMRSQSFQFINGREEQAFLKWTIKGGG